MIVAKLPKVRYICKDMEANPRHVPDLSVLVPVYGVERYIADCARSLFAQRDVDAEFVFVDDASPDGSVDRLREVMAEYPAVGRSQGCKDRAV